MNSGCLVVFTGPMFSGKTSHLLQEMTRYADISQEEPLLINSQLDQRDPRQTVSSHSSHYRGVSHKIKIFSTRTLSSVDITCHQVIGVDECQFFPDLVENVLAWVKQGKHVYCAGLHSDTDNRPFGQLGQLLHHADRFICLSAVCKYCLEELGSIVRPSDFTPAPFTARKESGPQVVVGGSDLYVAVCRRHHK